MASKVALIGIDAAIPTLVQKYFKMNKLPHMKKLASQGVWSEGIPVFPTHTASNWNSIATGAWPKTHGVTDMVVHMPGSPLTDVTSGFYSDLCKAEQLWVTAERADKKCILLKYIASWPPKITKGVQVEGFGAPGGPGSRPWGSSPLSLSNSSCFSSQQLEKSQVVTFTDANLSDWVGVSPSAAQPQPLETKITIGPKGNITYNILLAGSSGSDTYDTVYIAKESRGRGGGFYLKKGQVSDWIYEEFQMDGKPVKAYFRMKLMDVGFSGGKKVDFKLFISQIFPVEGWTYPAGLAKKLVDKVGPFLESVSHFPYVFGWTDEETYAEDFTYQSRWMAKATEYLMSENPWDLYMTQWHGIDNTQHAFLRFDKSVLTEKESETGDRLVLQSYEAADDLVGSIFAASTKNKDDDVYTFVLSDHGHIMGKRRFFINSYLLKNGLIRLKKDPATKKISIDWENTQAYAQGMVSVYVNLKGRDPNGSVSPGKEHEDVVDKIIDLLYDVKDPKTGKRPYCMALSNQHAEFLGLSGERTGDVIYATDPVYVSDNRISSSDELFADLNTGFRDGSIHGSQLPTADLGEHGTIKSMFIAHGPNIKKGYVRERPIHIVDIAPTISYILGIPAPKDSEGRVMHDLFV